MTAKAATLQSYHPSVLSTTIAGSTLGENSPLVGLQSSNAYNLACPNTSVSRANRALYWVLGELKQNTMQKLKNGFWYIEICPTYLSSIEGISRWAASEAWHQSKKAIPWLEVKLKSAVAMGAKIRSLKRGQKWGRHLLLTEDGKKSYIRCAKLCRDAGFFQAFGEPHNAQQPLVGVVSLPHALRGLQCDSGKRTAAVSCPLGHQHKHADKSPSLILWRNGSSPTGGAKCFTCGAKFAVRYNQQNAQLYTPRLAKVKSTQTPKNTPFFSHQHNKNLIGCKGTPIGGHVATTDRSYRHVGARLFGVCVDGSAQTKRSIGSGLKGGPIQALKWSENRSKGESARGKANLLSSCIDLSLTKQSKHWSPTSLVSVSSMRPSEWVNIGPYKRPSKWTAARQKWLLFDLDDICLKSAEKTLPNSILELFGGHDEFTGTAAVVQTGPVGLQIWVELKNERFSPDSWFSQENVRSWYRSIGNTILKTAQESGCLGGKVDMASCAPGRFGRRPGWRLLPDGNVFRSRLLGVKN